MVSETATGQTYRPYRPMPRDFPETFVRVGWEAIEAECRAHKKTIRAWIEAYNDQAIRDGQPTLQEMRREYLDREYGKRGQRPGGRRPLSHLSHRARYVMGLTRATARWSKPAPSFFELGLMEEER